MPADKNVDYDCFVEYLGEEINTEDEIIETLNEHTVIEELHENGMDKLYKCLQCNCIYESIEDFGNSHSSFNIKNKEEQNVEWEEVCEDIIEEDYNEEMQQEHLISGTENALNNVVKYSCEACAMLFDDINSAENHKCEEIIIEEVQLMGNHKEESTEQLEQTSNHKAATNAKKIVNNTSSSQAITCLICNTTFDNQKAFK